jgi:hypothetical protein
VASRIGISSEARHFSPDQDLFADVRAELGRGPIACVLIDEAQFLAAEQVRQLARVVDELNVPVLCYGLRTDFLGRAVRRQRAVAGVGRQPGRTEDRSATAGEKPRWWSGCALTDASNTGAAGGNRRQRPHTFPSVDATSLRPSKPGGPNTLIVAFLPRRVVRKCTVHRRLMERSSFVHQALRHGQDARRFHPPSDPGDSKDVQAAPGSAVPVSDVRRSRVTLAVLLACPLLVVATSVPALAQSTGTTAAEGSKKDRHHGASVAHDRRSSPNKTRPSRA